MGTIVLFLIFFSLAAWMLYGILHDESDLSARGPVRMESAEAVGTNTDSAASGDARHVHSAVAPHPNQQHLTDVRSRSCYPGLRGLHGFITFVAVAGCVVLWLVLMNVGNSTADRVYATFVCGLVTVGAILEYGLFTLIVDAVDVLIDMGRRAAGRE